MKWAVMAVLTALLAGCASPQPPTTLVPTDATIESMAPTDNGTLVAGYRGQEPFLAELDAQAALTAVPLHPTDPYAANATLVAVAADGDHRYGLGTAIGGAHSNARWSVWMGSSTSLTSYQQGFFTFGGHDAGPLLGIAVVDHEPVIVGVRTTQTGMRAVIYTAHATTWEPLPAEDALSSDAHRILSFTSVTTADQKLVVVGDDLQLTPTLTQSPSAWVGRPGSWRQVRLPVPDQVTGAGPSWATSAACTAHDCWIAGWAHGHPLAWELNLDTFTVSSVATLEGSTTDSTAKALVAITDGHPLVATNAATPTLQLACGSSWRTWPAPGQVQSLTATTGGVYVASDGKLWRFTTPRC